MRLITFERNGEQRLGAWVQDDRLIIDVAAVAAADLPAGASGSMLALIEAGPAAWSALDRLVARESAAATLRTADVRLLAPLPRPTQVRDFLSFEQHVVNAGRSAITILASEAPDPVAKRAELEQSGAWGVPPIWYKMPIYYTASRTATSHPEQDIRWPSYSQRLDFELELAAVIGTGGVDISRDRARDHIFGYTIFNDWSARDEQGLAMSGRLGPGKGKEFDGANTFGPCIVTADEIGDPYDLTMTARIDGEEWSRGSSSTMYHTFEDIIAYLSRGQTIHPGEILGSGTVGTGCGVELMRFLQGGETVELEIDRIGILRNRVVRTV